MLCRLMRRPLLLLALPVVAAAAVACGSEGIEVAKDSPEYDGAEIFHQRCAGCHSLDVAGAQGSAEIANKREYKDGPNFDQRKEEYEQVLYAIRNGGFSSGPMPQNIVTGEEAERLAEFVAKYSGSAIEEPDVEGGGAPEDCPAG
jgi:mono/diheme cytochrome c family protein